MPPTPWETLTPNHRTCSCRRTYLNSITVHKSPPCNSVETALRWEHVAVERAPINDIFDAQLSFSVAKKDLTWYSGRLELRCEHLNPFCAKEVLIEQCDISISSSFTSPKRGKSLQSSGPFSPFVNYLRQAHGQFKNHGTLPAPPRCGSTGYT